MLCLITLITFYYVLTQQVVKNAVQMSYNYSNELKALMETTIFTTMTTSSIVENRILTNRTSRPELESEFMSIANKLPDIQAIYAVFEQNKYGNNDNEFINTNYGSPVGRFVTYIMNTGDSFIPFYGVNELVEEVVKSGLYAVVKQHSKQDISAPYIFPLNNKDYYAVTISSPIMINDEFNGVVSVNILVDELFEKFSSDEIYKTGYITIITDTDLIAYSPIGEQISKPITEFFNEHFIQDIKNVDKNSSVQIVKGKSIINGKTIESYITPISFDGYDGIWKIAINIPVSESRFSANMVLVMAIIISIVVLGLIIYILLKTVNNVTKSITNLTEIAEIIAIGDIDVTLENDRDDELGKLSKAFSSIIENSKIQASKLQQIRQGDLTVHMDMRSDKDIFTQSIIKTIDKFGSVLNNIYISSEQLSNSSSNLLTMSEDIASGSCEQTNIITTLSNGIESIVSKINEDVNNIENVNNTVKDINKEFDLSKNQLIEMVKSINEVKSITKEIGSIINTIDNIATQTNIIALNASIEASRAGEFGKGFAVVANEIRDLAAQSTEAARITNDLINQSINSVDMGVSTVNTTSKSIFNAITSVKNIDTTIEKIFENSKAQSQFISNINENVKTISDIICGHSALAEEATATSEELSAQSVLLKEFVGEFKLKK